MDGLGSFTGIRGFRSRGQLGAWMAGGGVSAVSPSSAAAMAAAMVVLLGELGSVCLSQRGRVEREGGKALPRSNGARRVKERGAVPGVAGAGVCGVTVVCSPSGSNGRGRDAARRGLGRRSGDEMEQAASSSWKAMSRSEARRRGGVDERWQDTLLRSGSGSTACVRELGCAWLSSSIRRGMAVGACSRRRSLGQRGFAAHLAMAPEKEQRREREGRKRREEGQPKFDSN